MKKKYDWDENDSHRQFKYAPEQRDFYSKVSKKKTQEWDKYGERHTEYEHYKAIPKGKVLSKDQVLEIFWNKLVDQGWKLHTNSEGIEMLVLPCPICEQIVIQVIIANFIESNRVTESTFTSREIYKHQAGKGCSKATPEGK